MHFAGPEPKGLNAPWLVSCEPGFLHKAQVTLLVLRKVLASGEKLFGNLAVTWEGEVQRRLEGERSSCMFIF